MFWCEKLTEDIQGPQIINDSKTPSGRVHVGALRGVLIHDAIFRFLKEKEIPVNYLFGVDDYDPLDEIPSGEDEHFEQYLGRPLCNVPAPPKSNASDMAEHFIQEFFDVFDELGIKTEKYRMRDIYRSGEFNEAIDIILRNKDIVRKVYQEVSKSEKAEAWYPFQVICEQCGKIGTTEVRAYDGTEVEYRCCPNLVKWAKGCNYVGKISPFNGNGKLPWKLEWVAKWYKFKITIEGAGKDHSTKGGSRDVSSKCLREIFHQEPPLNIPYEFFLVGGAKMSSSKGVGVTARAMADFLPEEILRFLMLRTAPKRPVNFSPEEKSIIKVFNDYDRLHLRYFQDPELADEDRMLYTLSEIGPKGNFYAANFQWVTTLIQMPHLDAEEQIAKQKGSPLTPLDKKHIKRRIQAAQHWVDNYASEEEKTVLQEKLPERAQELSISQRAFLHRLSKSLENIPWEDEVIQSKIFQATRLTPIKQPEAFRAIYRLFLDRKSGPKAGNLLSVLKPGLVVSRLKELPYSKATFWTETGIDYAEFEKWVSVEKSRILSCYTVFEVSSNETMNSVGEGDNEILKEIGIIEFYLTLDDNKDYVKRVLFKKGHNIDGHSWAGPKEFTEFARDFVKRIEKKYQITNIQQE